MTLLSAVAPVEETPVDRFLAEQADLTAVERFAQRHEAELVPRQARYYRDLIPLAAPRPGQQYAFEVDLDSCTGCKACVVACHSLNGLDDGESWRKVTVLTGGTPAQPFQQTVTAACHHCVDPACMNGCPVDAYEKDPVTGIVTHLDDQCIGCGYCTLTCPYEVPVFNHSRGIVRKCDMCSGRLAAGEAPACVQACPNGAIAIAIVDAAPPGVAAGSLVPGAPPSAITRPTTVYRSERPHLYDMPVVSSAAGPAQSHPPLAAMLVLTQLAVGAFVIEFLLRRSSGGAAGVLDAVVAAGAGVLALGASVLHLGRPRLCYRAVLGLRHSWLSREVVAFGAFTALATLYAALAGLWPAAPAALPTALAGAAAALGLAGVACSVLIYTTTRRASWRPSLVSAKFLLTTAAGGIATVLWGSLVSAAVSGRGPGVGGSPAAALALAALVAVKLLGEIAWTPVAHASLRRTVEARALAGVAGVGLPLLLAATTNAPLALRLGLATVALAAVVTGELLERLLFFTTASPPR